MTDHFVEVPKKVLSTAAKAAKAVLDAFTEDNSLHDWKVHIHHLDALAAALRALADQVVPHPDQCPWNSYMDGVRDANQDVRAAILAIATELENAQ